MASVRLHTDISSLNPVAGDWNRLSGGIPFRRWEWMRAWWEYYGRDQHGLFVVTVHDNDECIGIAPFYVRQESIGRSVRVIGEGEVCSDHLAMLALPEHAQLVGESLAEWFAAQQSDGSGRNDSSSWDLMEIEWLSETCPVFGSFLRAAEEHGLLVRSALATMGTWRLDLPESMEEYLACLSKSSRRNVRAAVKRFDRGDYDIVVAGQDDFERCWEELVDLHQRRQNSIGNPGCFASCSFSEFLLDVSKQFLGQDILELTMVRREGLPVAAEILFRGDDTSFAYQVGINPDALKQNPGWLVNVAAVRAAIAQGQSAVDWCRGDEDYKRRLGAKRTQGRKYRIVPPRLRSQLWNAALEGKSTVKGWLKSGLTAAGIYSNG